MVNVYLEHLFDMEVMLRHGVDRLENDATIRVLDRENAYVYSPLFEV